MKLEFIPFKYGYAKRKSFRKKFFFEFFAYILAEMALRGSDRFFHLFVNFCAKNDLVLVLESLRLLCIFRLEMEKVVLIWSSTQESVRENIIEFIARRVGDECIRHNKHAKRCLFISPSKSVDDLDVCESYDVICFFNLRSSCLEKIKKESLSSKQIIVFYSLQFALDNDFDNIMNRVVGSNILVKGVWDLKKGLVDFFPYGYPFLVVHSLIYVGSEHNLGNVRFSGFDFGLNDRYHERYFYRKTDAAFPRYGRAAHDVFYNLIALRYIVEQFNWVVDVEDSFDFVNQDLVAIRIVCEKFYSTNFGNFV